MAADRLTISAHFEQWFVRWLYLYGDRCDAAGVEPDMEFVAFMMRAGGLRIITQPAP